jgi:hypothetical protein
MVNQVLLLVGPKVAMFTFELLDPTGVVDALMGMQVVFVGEFSSTCQTWVGSLFNGEVYGQVNVEKGLADSSIGAQVTPVGSSALLRHPLSGVRDVTGPMHVFRLLRVMEEMEESPEIVVLVEELGTVRAQVYRPEASCLIVDAGVNEEVKAGCKLCMAMGAGVDDRDVDRHRL